VLATQAPAQNPNIAIVPYAGYNLDFEELFFGGGVSIPIPSAQLGRGVLILHPSFELYPFIDGATLWAIVANAVLNFPLSGTTPIEPYALAGLTIQRVSVDIPIVGSVSNTDVLFNFGGGLAFGQSFFRTHPFVEIVAVLGSGSTVLFKGGVRIATGG
jgi:hypothetical protein